jgi:nitroreductase
MASLPADELAKWERVSAAGHHLADHLHEAPAILMFCANPRFMAITDAKLDRISMVGGGSVYPAVQNAMLACVAEGLGCTLTTLHCLREAEVKALLDVPEKWATVGMVPIGYPVGRGHGPITRQPPSELAYRDTFGTPWASG